MTENVIISLIGALASTLTALGIAYLNFKIAGIHKQMNSRLDQLLKSEKETSKLEGAKEEREKPTS